MFSKLAIVTNASLALFVGGTPNEAIDLASGGASVSAFKLGSLVPRKNSIGGRPSYSPATDEYTVMLTGPTIPAVLAHLERVKRAAERTNVTAMQMSDYTNVYMQAALIDSQFPAPFVFGVSSITVEPTADYPQPATDGYCIPDIKVSIVRTTPFMNSFAALTAVVVNGGTVSLSGLSPTDITRLDPTISGTAPLTPLAWSIAQDRAVQPTLPAGFIFIGLINDGFRAFDASGLAGVAANWTSQNDAARFPATAGNNVLRYRPTTVNAETVVNINNVIDGDRSPLQIYLKVRSTIAGIQWTIRPAFHNQAGQTSALVTGSEVVWTPANTRPAVLALPPITTALDTFGLQLQVSSIAGTPDLFVETILITREVDKLVNPYVIDSTTLLTGTDTIHVDQYQVPTIFANAVYNEPTGSEQVPRAVMILGSTGVAESPVNMRGDLYTEIRHNRDIYALYYAVPGATDFWRVMNLAGNAVVFNTWKAYRYLGFEGMY